MRILLRHLSQYTFPTEAALGPHMIRLRPASHTKASIESYGLTISPEGSVHHQQDPYGNHVARLTYAEGVRVPHLRVLVEIACDLHPVNPFDFFLDDRMQEVPFEYPAELRADLLPFLDTRDASVAGGERLTAFLAGLPAAGPTVALAVSLCDAVNHAIRYVIREEAGIWTPEETLTNGRGSCRDSAVLLIAALRSRGLAARFVSGYLVQLTDEGMQPNAPRGVSRDVADLHAWAEVFLPGAGWIGLDATSGLLCGEGHIPLAATATPALAAPIEGTSDVLATSVAFSLSVARLGHEPRPTRPYEEPVWEAILAAGDAADARLVAKGLSLTMGGEPTFNALEDTELPEWNGEALGPSKWKHGQRLAAELLGRLAPGGFVLRRFGKLYPGESLPRWALDVLGRRDGVALLTPVPASTQTRADARLFAATLAARLGLADSLLPAFEDPWRFVQEEARLPVDVDPHAAKLDDPEERRRLARVLERGLGSEAGYVLPLSRNGGTFASDAWTFRRGRLHLLPGDSPIGLRLPLGSLSPGVVPVPPEPACDPPDPRREAEIVRQEAIRLAAPASGSRAIRTALCVEEREGRVHVFLPPLATADDFLALVSEIDAVRVATGIDVALEGYPPPSSPNLLRFAVTPDPGVLEVNLPPTATFREHASLVGTTFDAALHAGLHSETYLLDGRPAGSGGGNHLTLGGPSALESPFLRNPALLASFLTFLQHHPSLSYMFAGLFVGPTSQAPRVDEARHDSLYELEIALAHAFRQSDSPTPPWLPDLLFRHFLVDLTGNTHRAEVSIDKLFDPASSYGRQGLVELRAFEMPPHPRMVSAQMLLVRSLVAAFADAPYRHPLVRFGATLHDRFLLPHFLWRDFEDVLAFLADRGLPLPAEAFRPFVELRCPLAGRLVAGDVTLEVRNALEPWPVLGEVLSGTG
ncbi:MAG: transglutaminase family protein, partial [Acidobacteria bacterium]|nr:transglutaminase family protein [Acidobacteriota bacterium]